MVGKIPTKVRPVYKCQAGDPEAAKKRIGFVKGLPVLSITGDVIKLAEIYAKLLNIPEEEVLKIKDRK